MKIEIWSDFVCPFCYIGKQRIEQALELFPHKEHVTVSFRSFELNPNGESNSTSSIHEAMAKKMGVSVEQAKTMNTHMANLASQDGLTFNYDGMKPTNTLNAHRLLKYASEHGKASEMAEQLYKAYFTDEKLISDHETLIELATTIGLVPAQVSAMLQSDGFTDKVREDEAYAKAIGVKGVPFIVFNERQTLSGLHPVETLVGALHQVWQDTQDRELAPATATQCTDEQCKM